MKCENCSMLRKVFYEYSEMECFLFGEYVPKELMIACDDGCRLTRKEIEKLYELWIKFCPYPIEDEEERKENDIVYEKFKKKLDQFIKRHTIERNCAGCYYLTDEDCTAFFNDIPPELQADKGCGCRLNNRELSKLSKLKEEAEDTEKYKTDKGYEKYDKYIAELIERKGKYE